MYRGNYGLVGNQMSMFTRKLEAQLRFQGIPWYWHFKTHEGGPLIEARTGSHFIPALIKKAHQLKKNLFNSQKSFKSNIFEYTHYIFKTGSSC